ncbi:acetyl-CoA carboxylase biotin carboxyl carrier protein [Faecalicatena orotica]|uniref:Biotin carboxyl carrier protein of acetyl-CoA carboxylase n=1 Tax=Faecalicatena orotica TaxID=1544 RepID=A0A2Y9BHF6_9FIRM|nr:acetyl-CoA carboxylase biotin carboxyl carrier protein [Faecalicatena orotica]PWJ27860.1 acetyl-CoA carboxylase biotin carboxyl carrier protein [Faecalicatena orotica]SSA56881.1 acetyl-CoA carboxylase biotin carboxyl carrier protein [Faecalicatena orotica]
MKIEEILQLVDSVSKSALAEFKYEEGGVKLSLKKAAAVQYAATDAVAYTQAPVSPAAQKPAVTAEMASDETAYVAAASASDTPAEKKADGKVVKSPLVGTFYSAPSEEAEPFISVGDSVKEGQVIAIVEAMKLMNEIESDFSGKVAEILVQNGDTVEYGQPLFVIK